MATDDEGTRKRRDYEVGGGKPPKATRWPKGQSGNPRRSARRDAPSDAALIEQLFRRRYGVVEDGVRVSRTGLEIVFAQLLRKETAGDRAAARVRDRCLRFVDVHHGVLNVVLRPIVDPQDLAATPDGVEGGPQKRAKSKAGDTPRDERWPSDGKGETYAFAPKPPEDKP